MLIPDQGQPDDGALLAAQLAAIVESSDDAIISKDLGGIILSWNRGAQAIFGYTAEEVVGGPVQILFPPDRVAEEDEIVRRIRRGERVDHFETVRRRKDGTDFHASVTISPIRDAQGAIVGASKILRDVSESHRAQLELRDAKRSLEQALLEKTRALAERDLLLREVYHRVKNNLQVVDGLLVLESRKLQDPQAREALAGLRARIFALALVHQQLMGSSDLRTFDVAPFLRELSENLIEGAADERVSLTVEATPIPVGLDFAIPLGMLVTELVTNCAKHAFPAGGGHVRVTLNPAADGRLLLTVADDGVGPSDVAPPRKPGFGSNIVERLVGQLDGELTVRKEGGTIVEALLPLPEPLWTH
ncbi:sensor histidine kinase [Caulobacter sp. KR2-114]|uniref:sensor histidine kinase n=1 Tax=Caulobacter sp. KR2-114 TaxID=3400912 RepID=UPI003C118D04